MNLDKIKITPLLKVNLGKYKKESSYIDTYNLDRKIINKSSNLNIITKKKRPLFDILKKEEDVIDFNIFNYKYSFGFFAGCNSFSFRVTFKEYKQGLKASKFSLLLNQFNLNIERFTSLIEEILVNNFSFDFYENLFGSALNDMDLKIHFLVILRNKDKYNTSSKFFIVPKGCYIVHVRNLLWYTLSSDLFFVHYISLYYKGFKKHIGLILLLVIFYVMKLIHFNLQRL